MGDFEQFAWRLAQILAWDPGNRRLLAVIPPPDLAGATEALLEAERVLVVTGFPVASKGIGETDGPLGAAHIAHALTALGKQVLVVTDLWSQQLVQAACAFRAPKARLETIPQQGAAQACRQLMEREQPDLVVAIERPGKGEDGQFHNMRGQVIDNMTADTELLLELAPCSITIGDGGNELGLGTFAQQVRDNVYQGPIICAKQGADYPLTAGISNWWGWGIEALLSAKTGQLLLPDDRQEQRTLAQVVQAGGVDGVTGLQQQTVDGLTLEENLQVLRQVRQLLQEYGLDLEKGEL